MHLHDPTTNTWHTLPYSSRPSPKSCPHWRLCSRPIPTPQVAFSVPYKTSMHNDCNYLLTYLALAWTMWFWVVGTLLGTFVFIARDPESYTLLAENIKGWLTRVSSKKNNTERATLQSVHWIEKQQDFESESWREDSGTGGRSGNLGGDG